MTALTAYMTNTVASTIATADTLLENPTTGAAVTNNNTNLTASTTGWVEIRSQGTGTSQTGAGSEPAPSGNGWIDDGTTFVGKQFSSGTWTFVNPFELSVSGGTLTADVHFRAYQRSSGGVYTLIAEATASAQTLSSSAFNNVTATSASVAASNTFVTGDKLYIDCIFNITTNTTSANIRMRMAQSSTLGSVNSNVITPGYVVPTQYKDGVSRFKTNASKTKDGLTRFLQRSATQFKNGLSRFRLSATKTKDGKSRFKQSASVKKDARVRFGLGLTRSAVIRFAQANTTFKDAITRFRQSNLSAHDFYTRFIQYATKAVNAKTRFRQLSSTVSLDGIARFALRQLTAVTVYLTAGASNDSTIIAGNKLLSTGNSSQNVTNFNSLIGTSIGYGEIYAKGTSSTWFGGNTAPNPSGNGYIWEVTTLEGNAFQPGAWSGNLQLSVSSGSIVADIHLRSWKRSSAGSYVAIVDMVYASKTINTTNSVFAVSNSTTSASPLFNSGDKLYIDVVANIKSNSTNSGTATVKINASTSTTIGSTHADVVTSGFTPPVSATKSAQVLFRQTMHRAKDGWTRFKQSVSKTLNGVSRFKISAKKSQDADTRFRQYVPKKVDAQSRLKLFSAPQYRTGLSRLRVTQHVYLDGIGRFRLISPMQYKNGITRLLLRGARTLGGVSRFIQYSGALYKDGAARFRLLFVTQKSGIARFVQKSGILRVNALNRFKQAAAQSKNSVSRLRLSSIATLDALALFRQAAAIKADAKARLKMNAQVYLFGITRLKLNSVLQYRNSQTRFKQATMVLLNATNRFLQSALIKANGITRFKQYVPKKVDFPIRMRLSGSIYGFGKGRFRLNSPIYYRGGSLRLRQSVPVLLNFAARLKIAIFSPRSAVVRLVARAPKAPSFIGRFRQSIPTAFDDKVRLRTAGGKNLGAVTRFLSSYLRLHDHASRFRQSIKTSRNFGTRLRLSGLVYDNAVAHIKTASFVYRSAMTRFRQNVPTAKDAVVRFLACVFRSLGAETRLRTRAPKSLNCASRFQQRTTTQYRNGVGRFRQYVPVVLSADARIRTRSFVTPDTDIRFRQSVPVKEDAKVRFLTGKLVQSNGKTRFRQSVTVALGAAILFVTRMQVLRDARTRFRQSIPASVAGQTRLLQSVFVVTGGKTRLRQNNTASRSTHTRLRQSVPVVRDAAIYLLTYGKNPRDGRVRFVLKPSTISPITAATTDVIFRDGNMEAVFRS